VFRKSKFRKSKYLVGLIAMILLLALPATAFGAYAYDYADNDFIYSTAGLSFANNTWYLLGLTYNSNYGSLFTKFRVLGGMPLMAMHFTAIPMETLAVLLIIMALGFQLHLLVPQELGIGKNLFMLIPATVHIIAP